MRPDVRFLHGDRRGRTRDRLRDRDQAGLHRGRRRGSRARAPGRVSRSPAAPTGTCTAVGLGRSGSTPGFASAEETNAAFPLSARPRADGALGRLRPADAARLRLRRHACARRGGADRRRDRLDRRHGAALRRHPAERGLDLDDDQRAGGAAAPALRARRGGAGRVGRRPAGHGPERRPQGVLRARQLHLPAAADRCGSRPTCSRTATNGCRASTRSRSPGTTSARPARPRCRSSRSPSRTGSPTRRPRSTRGSRPTSSASGSRSSSTPTTTSSRRSRSSGRRGACGRGS